MATGKKKAPVKGKGKTQGQILREQGDSRMNDPEFIKKHFSRFDDDGYGIILDEPGKKAPVKKPAKTKK